MNGARLLCVVAHPDDECVAFGGALALAKKQGADVSIVCLTDGQAATYRGTAKSAAELGAMRRAEFHASCEVLGATHHEILDYQDAKLEFEDVSALAGVLVERIRRWKPHVVVTFGLDGAVNTHPDHAMTGAATSMAFQWSARAKRYPDQLSNGMELWAPQKLYLQTSNYLLPGREHLSPAPWSLRLDISSVMDIKRKAFDQHTSQQPIMQNIRGLWEMHHEEFYLLAAAVTPREIPHEGCMFEGVTV